MWSRTIFAIVSLVGAGTAAYAQDEAALRRAFEGTSVVARIDMPATSAGVEVHPTASTPVDFRKVGDLIKADGIGVHRGDAITVTKVVVKARHVEFQLGGGGYGTFSDTLSAPSAPYVEYEWKSYHQRDLEEDLKYTYDSRTRREIKDEIRHEEQSRQRDNAVAAAVNAQAQAANQATIADRRAHSGSRFNIRYNEGFPPGALTPDGVRSALQAYLDFGGGRERSFASTAAAPDPSGGTLRKGLTVLQVEQMLGPAAKVSDRSDGSLAVNVREYATEAEQVSCQFVGGVLVNYQVTPRDR